MGPSPVIGTEHIAFVTAPLSATAGGAARVLDLTPPFHVSLIALWLEHATSKPRDAFLRTPREAPGG